jgi:hypothetical protein
LLKYFALLPLAALLGAPLNAQDGPPLAETPADNGNVPASLIQPIERAADYLNFYAFFNGIYDTSNEYGAGTNADGFGTQAGGGVSANHDFARGTLSFGYRGDYRSSGNSELPGGTEQTLTFFYRRLITRRLTLSFAEEGGTYPEGTVLQEPTITVDQQFVQTSPYALTYRFNASTITAAYRQTARLSYEFTGTFTLARYTSPVGLGSDDLIGTASALYALTPATTLSGTYQEMYYHFQRNAGTARTASTYLTLSHALPSHWTLGASAGATHADDDGSYPIPIYLKSGNSIIPFVYVGHYATSANLPYFSGSASRNWHHSLASFRGGESVTPGNGVFLTSRTLGISGVFSYGTRRSNISASGSFSRLTSAANAATTTYRAIDFGGGYSYNLIRHLGANTRYDHVTTEFVGSSASGTDNRLSIGLYFTSKDIPLAIF